MIMDKKKLNVLVTGGNGQLGCALRAAAKGSSDRYVFTDISTLPGEETVYLDVTNPAAVEIVCDSEMVDVIINCASYTDVEGAEGEGEEGEGNAAMNEKKDKLLFEVAKWAIECGNGLSTSAVQRHFSVGYSRAGKIVDQLFGMGLCARSTGNSKPRAMLIGMDELMQLERSGAFR